MKEEILIGLGAIILSGLTYFAGVKRTEKKYLQTERQSRIQSVLEKYLQFLRTNTTGGLDGLQKSGIATLASNDEILELIDLIVKHGKGHPFGSYSEMLKSEDLKALFDYSVRNDVNFFRTPLEEIIEKYKSA